MTIKWIVLRQFSKQYGPTHFKVYLTGLEHQLWVLKENMQLSAPEAGSPTPMSSCFLLQLITFPRAEASIIIVTTSFLLPLKMSLFSITNFTTNAIIIVNCCYYC